MLVSDDRKLIFVRVHKTAGISIETVLQAQCPDLRRWHGRHGHAADGIEQIGRERWDGYFSFAFVRNPWDRLVSWYAMIEAAKCNLTEAQLASQRPFKSELWNYALRCSHDFESFLTECTGSVYDMGCRKSFAFDQLAYLSDEHGNIAVDFVGRFERLAPDFARVCQRLDLNGVTLPRRNASEHAHYSKWYTPETQALVARRFARDIAAFGYRLEASAAP